MIALFPFQFARLKRMNTRDDLTKEDEELNNIDLGSHAGLIELVDLIQCRYTQAPLSDRRITSQIRDPANIFGHQHIYYCLPKRNTFHIATM